MSHVHNMCSALVLLVEPGMRDDIQMAITENYIRILTGMSWLES